MQLSGPCPPLSLGRGHVSSVMMMFPLLSFVTDTFQALIQYPDVVTAQAAKLVRPIVVKMATPIKEKPPDPAGPFGSFPVVA
jgi:hypothetical protein